MITTEQVDEALEYLALTDAHLGDLVGRCEGLNHRIKARKGLAFLEADGTVGERNAGADSDDEVRKLCEKHEDAIASRETVRANRKRRELIIDVFRTQQANQRKGNFL